MLPLSIGCGTGVPSIAPHTEGVADQVRIPRPKVGERLAQRDILQTKGAGIFARSANTLVPSFLAKEKSLEKSRLFVAISFLSPFDGCGGGI